MLKKFIYLLLAIGFLFVAKSIYAQRYISLHTVTNDTAVETTSYVSTSTIATNRSRIFGWTVEPTRNASTNPYVSLWDETSTDTHSHTTMIGESEADAGNTGNKQFPYPKMISNQVKVCLGPYSAVTIEYTK